VILHVAGLDKFIPPFVKLIKEEFEEEKHQFWLTGSVEQYPVEQSESVYVCGGGIWRKLAGCAKLVKQLHSARKVMLHGLFNIRVVLVLALCPWVLPKCYWIIWGGDLYQFRKAGNTWQSHIKEALRRFVIRRVGHLVTYIEGDVELARQWYGAKGTYHECIMYLSNVVDPKVTAESAPASDHDGLNILLGNSADPSNNHIEALERLLPFKDQAIKIYAPLSYGDQNHAKKVISQGKAWFGDKFVPMTDFMPFEQYLEFLKSLDIAIFNHQRQQAMGNTITLLGMGKTVFMRSDVSQWGLLNTAGIAVLDVERGDLKLLDTESASDNVKVIKERFSRGKLIEQYARIFGS
jgi:hypothetical protein